MPGITDPNEQYFKDGLWGWNGSEWRKLAMVWGYSDQYVDRVTDTGDGGNLTLYLSVVPSDEIWIVTAFNATPMDGPQTSQSWIGYRAGSSSYAMKFVPSLQQYESIVCPTPILLKEGDNLRVFFNSAANGDEFYAYANGYKMKIAE